MSKSDKWPPDWWMGGKMSKSGKAISAGAGLGVLAGMIGTAIKNKKAKKEAAKEMDPNTAIDYVENKKKKKKNN